MRLLFAPFLVFGVERSEKPPLLRTQGPCHRRSVWSGPVLRFAKSSRTLAKFPKLSLFPPESTLQLNVFESLGLMTLWRSKSNSTSFIGGTRLTETLPTPVELWRK
ncbi:hypothetical protein INR49_013670 [Caranx melampygus]|nr:hypothetical protein INR49_013670 [Caranx melampygus]